MITRFKFSQLTHLALGLALLLVLLVAETTPATADSLAELTAIGGGGERILPNGAFSNDPSCQTGVFALQPSRVFEYRFALEFDLASIPPGSQIHAATLYLRSVIGIDSGPTAMYGYGGNGAIEMNDMTAGSLAVSFTPTSPSGEWLDVTASVLERWANGDRWAGFSIRQEPLGSNWGSWECPDTGSRPLLIIAYSVPDNTPPLASASAALPANANGWHNSDVTVTWNWTDEGGIDPANCTTSTLVSDEGVIMASASCTDLAGNSGSVSYPVRIDKTPRRSAPLPRPIRTAPAGTTLM